MNSTVSFDFMPMFMLMTGFHSLWWKTRGSLLVWFRGGSSALDVLRFQHFPYHNRERGGHADVWTSFSFNADLWLLECKLSWQVKVCKFSLFIFLFFSKRAVGRRTELRSWHFSSLSDLDMNLRGPAKKLQSLQLGLFYLQAVSITHLYLAAQQLPRIPWACGGLLHQNTIIRPFSFTVLEDQSYMSVIWNLQGQC